MMTPFDTLLLVDEALFSSSHMRNYIDTI